VRAIRAVAPSLLAVLAVVATAAAHGSSERYPLPAPLWLWVVGAAAIVASSFVVIAPLVRGPAVPGRYGKINLLRWKAGRLLVHPRVWLAGQMVSSALLVLIVAAGVIGTQNPMRNLAPAAIWGVGWVGLACLSALVGDAWKVVNPWSALFAAVTRFVAGGSNDRATVAYPRSLACWPAVGLFGAFVWTEFVYDDRAIPARLALLTIGYSVITWTGMAIFGRAVWLRHGDPFAVAFGVLARFAPTELRVNDPAGCRHCASECAGQDDGCVNCVECFRRAPGAGRELNLRPFAAGLLSSERVSSSSATFVMLLVASVIFDGFTATPPWSTIEASLYALAPGGPDLRLTTVATAGLLGVVGLFLVVYRVMACAVGRAFVLSLVPIAVAYHVAHHLAYLLTQGWLAIRLVSDPFGFGWDLLGTADLRADLGLVDARFSWYTAVAAIVIGHIVAVYVSRATALQQRAGARAAVLGQLLVLLFLVASTTTGVWIIAQPIVEWPGTP
jgi:polyferredoxin